MYNNKVKLEIETIESAFKSYSSDSSNKNKALKRLAESFNIPIDESRIGDYTIKDFDPASPSIVILDQKTNTKYISKYSDAAYILNYSCNDVIFNNLTIITPTHKIKRIYYIGYKEPIIEQMTFGLGTYDLIFEREFPNTVGMFANVGVKFTIKYLEKKNINNMNTSEDLLTRIYTDSSYNEYKYLFEHEYSENPNSYGGKDRYLNKFAYIKDDSVIYGIGNLKNMHYKLSGMCIENTNDDLEDYFQLHMDINNYPELMDDNNKSAMLFKGNSQNSSFRLEIYKHGSIASIMYLAVDTEFNSIITDHKFDIQLLDSNNISNKEIQIIIDTLKEKYDGDEFIDLISEELLSFAKKIGIKNGTLQDSEDLVNPKFYINQSFDEISKTFIDNKDDFFKTIDEEYRSIVDTNQSNDKAYSKTFKNNNKNSDSSK